LSDRTPATRPILLQACAVDFTARHFLLPLMRAQRDAGFDVRLACAPGVDAPVVAAEGFQIYPIPFRRSMNVLAHGVAYWRLGQLLRRLRPTVVHCHTPVASLVARPAARRAGVPVVIYTAHGFYFHDAMSPAKRRLHVGLERLAQRRWADWLFTQSSEDLATAIREGIAPADRAEAIGNGVDLARFARERFPEELLRHKRQDLGLEPEDGPIVIMIGRLVREKGYFELLEAFARARAGHPRARLLAIGDALPSDRDAVAEKIRARAMALGVGESVIFAGLRSDVPALLALGDIFCLPSWREGMPRSLIEAMAAGLPVVATDIRGCREEVIDGQTGLLVPPRQAAPLAEALKRLLGDADLRARMGRAGRERAVQYFDEQAVIARQMVVLRRLFAEKRLPWPRPLT
jgi:glycosyltransferase involved in cell wall biosynthesis